MGSSLRIESRLARKDLMSKQRQHIEQNIRRANVVSVVVLKRCVAESVRYVMREGEKS